MSCSRAKAMRTILYDSDRDATRELAMDIGRFLFIDESKAVLNARYLARAQRYGLKS
jgi:hypothetical protein